MNCQDALHNDVSRLMLRTAAKRRHAPQGWGVSKPPRWRKRRVIILLSTPDTSSSCSECGRHSDSDTVRNTVALLTGDPSPASASEFSSSATSPNSTGFSSPCLCSQQCSACCQACAFVGCTAVADNSKRQSSSHNVSSFPMYTHGFTPTRNADAQRSCAYLILNPILFFRILWGFLKEVSFTLVKLRSKSAGGDARWPVHRHSTPPGDSSRRFATRGRVLLCLFNLLIICCFLSDATPRPGTDNAGSDFFFTSCVSSSPSFPQTSSAFLAKSTDDEQESIAGFTPTVFARLRMAQTDKKTHNPVAQQLAPTAQFLILGNDGMVHAVTAEGKLRWSRSLGRNVQESFAQQQTLYRPTMSLSQKEVLSPSVSNAVALPFPSALNASDQCLSAFTSPEPSVNSTRRFVPGPDGQIFFRAEDGVLTALPLHVRDIVFHSPFSTPLFPSIYFLGKREAVVEILDLETGETAGRATVDSVDGKLQEQNGGVWSQLRVGQTRWVVRAMDVLSHVEKWRLEWKELTPIVNFGGDDVAPEPSVDAEASSLEMQSDHEKESDPVHVELASTPEAQSTSTLASLSEASDHFSDNWNLPKTGFASIFSSPHQMSTVTVNLSDNATSTQEVPSPEHLKWRSPWETPKCVQDTSLRPFGVLEFPPREPQYKVIRLDNRMSDSTIALYVGHADIAIQRSDTTPLLNPWASSSPTTFRFEFASGISAVYAIEPQLSAQRENAPVAHLLRPLVDNRKKPLSLPVSQQRPRERGVLQSSMSKALVKSNAPSAHQNAQPGETLFVLPHHLSSKEGFPPKMSCCRDRLPPLRDNMDSDLQAYNIYAGKAPDHWYPSFTAVKTQVKRPLVSLVQHASLLERDCVFRKKSVLSEKGNSQLIFNHHRLAVARFDDIYLKLRITRENEQTDLQLKRLLSRGQGYVQRYPQYFPFCFNRHCKRSPEQREAVAVAVVAYIILVRYCSQLFYRLCFAAKSGAQATVVLALTCFRILYFWSSELPVTVITSSPFDGNELQETANDSSNFSTSPVHLETLGGSQRFLPATLYRRHNSFASFLNKTALPSCSAALDYEHLIEKPRLACDNVPLCHSGQLCTTTSIQSALNAEAPVLPESYALKNPDSPDALLLSAFTTSCNTQAPSPLTSSFLFSLTEGTAQRGSGPHSDPWGFGGHQRSIRRQRRLSDGSLCGSQLDAVYRSVPCSPVASSDTPCFFGSQRPPPVCQFCLPTLNASEVLFQATSSSHCSAPIHLGDNLENYNKRRSLRAQEEDVSAFSRQPFHLPIGSAKCPLEAIPWASCVLSPREVRNFLETNNTTAKTQCDQNTRPRDADDSDNEAYSRSLLTFSGFHKRDSVHTYVQPTVLDQIEVRSPELAESLSPRLLQEHIQPEVQEIFRAYIQSALAERRKRQRIEHLNCKNEPSYNHITFSTEGCGGTTEDLSHVSNNPSFESFSSQHRQLKQTKDSQKLSTPGCQPSLVGDSPRFSNNVVSLNKEAPLDLKHFPHTAAETSQLVYADSTRSVVTATESYNLQNQRFVSLAPHVSTPPGECYEKELAAARKSVNVQAPTQNANHAKSILQNTTRKRRVLCSLPGPSDLNSKDSPRSQNQQIIEPLPLVRTVHQCPDVDASGTSEGLENGILTQRCNNKLPVTSVLCSTKKSLLDTSGDPCSLPPHHLMNESVTLPPPTVGNVLKPSIVTSSLKVGQIRDAGVPTVCVHTPQDSISTCSLLYPYPPAQHNHEQPLASYSAALQAKHGALPAAPTFSNTVAKPNVPQSNIPIKSVLAGFVDNGRFYRTFKDIRLIGKGGFGSVYRVKHRFEPDFPEYAVKFVTLRLRASENISSRRYFREVSANRDLFSRQVVRYFTWWCEEPQFLPQDHCTTLYNHTVPEHTSENNDSNKHLVLPRRVKGDKKERQRQQRAVLDSCSDSSPTSAASRSGRQRRRQRFSHKCRKKIRSSKFLSTGSPRRRVVRHRRRNKSHICNAAPLSHKPIDTVPDSNRFCQRRRRTPEVERILRLRNGFPCQKKQMKKPSHYLNGVPGCANEIYDPSKSNLEINEVFCWNHELDYAKDWVPFTDSSTSSTGNLNVTAHNSFSAWHQSSCQHPICASCDPSHSDPPGSPVPLTRHGFTRKSSTSQCRINDRVFSNRYSSLGNTKTKRRRSPRRTFFRFTKPNVICPTQRTSSALLPPRRLVVPAMFTLKQPQLPSRTSSADHLSSRPKCLAMTSASLRSRQYAWLVSRPRALASAINVHPSLAHSGSERLDNPHTAVVPRSQLLCVSDALKSSAAYQVPALCTEHPQQPRLPSVLQPDEDDFIVFTDSNAAACKVKGVNSSDASQDLGRNPTKNGDTHDTNKRSPVFRCAPGVPRRNSVYKKLSSTFALRGSHARLFRWRHYRSQKNRNFPQLPTPFVNEELRFPVTLLIQMELVSGMTLREWLDRKERTTSVQEMLSRFIQPPLTLTAGSSISANQKSVAQRGEETTTQQRRCVPPLELVLFRQLLKGLRDIHTHGIVHRDIKPENIFVNDAKLTLKIGDFGLARFIEAKTIPSSKTSVEERQHKVEQHRAELPHARVHPFVQSSEHCAVSHRSIKRIDSVVSVQGLVIGTPGYTAPEGGALCTEKADVFSASLILLELLCPRFGTAMERYKTLENFRVRQKIPEHIVTYLSPWADLMKRMGAVNPRDRPSADTIYRSIKFGMNPATLYLPSFCSSSRTQALLSSVNSVSGSSLSSATLHRFHSGDRHENEPSNDFLPS